MLKINQVSNFEDRSLFLKKQAQSGFYIASDIKSKLQYKQYLLEEQLLHRADCIERAQDFFSKLLITSQPKYSFISQSHFTFLYNTWSKDQGIKSFSPKASLVFEALKFYLPILSHPQGEEVYIEWLKNNTSDSTKNLDGWMVLIRKFWSHLKELNLIERSLSKYLLLDQSFDHIDQSLVVDLGFNLDSIDVDLLNQLSKYIDIDVLMPSPTSAPIYPEAYNYYKLLDQSRSVSESKKDPDIFTKSSASTAQVKETYHFQNMIQEVQFITSYFRNLLNTTQLNLEDLAIVAPQIESYWPCLKNYLRIEGLLVQKGEFALMSSFPQIQKWLASIRFYSGDISFQNFEQLLFKKKESYSKFKSKYYHSDKKEDLKNLNYEHSFHHASSIMTLDEFLNWTHELWAPLIKRQPNHLLRFKVENILSEMALPLSYLSETKAELSAWIEMLEEIISLKEICIREDGLKGIACVSANAIHSLSASHVAVIGLNHDSCQSHFPHFLNQKEALSIFTDLGFSGFHKDPSSMDYEIYHYIHTAPAKVVLSYSETDSQGYPIYPSRTWMIENENNKDIKKEHLPVQTVWSSIQKQSSIKQIYENTKSVKYHSDLFPTLETFEESLSQGEQKQHFMPPIENKLLDSLSNSNIQDYVKCPFIFLSKKLFHLEDIPYKDLDVNTMDQGSVVHNLLRDVVEKEIHTDEQIETLIDSVKTDLYLLEEEVWPIYKKRFTRIIKRFLENEQIYKEKLPELQNKGVEISFEAYWNFKTKKLEKEQKNPNDILIRGRIDRMDHVKGEAVIIDYKRSTSSKTNIGTWNNNSDIQMPLYIQAAELGLLDSQLTHVSGAIYLNFRNFEMKGLILKESPFKALSPTSRMSCSKENKEKELKSLNESIGRYMDSIDEGHFKPKPQKSEQCEKCQWRQICRYPQLI